MNVYAAFGLTIASDIALPDLSPGSGAADVVIRFGPVALPDDAPAGFRVERDAATLVVPAVGRFRIAGGREIVIAPEPAAEPDDVALFASGSAMGAILHQRGIVPLHANAIGFDGAAVAFLGPSGAGKSTLARWFHNRGHPILSDDVCAVTPGTDRGFVAQPGVPRLRLWRDAIERAGGSTDGLDRSFRGVDKFNVRIAEQRSPLPLGAIYVLRRAAGDEPAITRLSGIAAAAALSDETYRGGYVDRAGQLGDHMLACAAIARAVPVFVAERVWGHDQFDAGAAEIADHVRAVIAGRIVADARPG